MSEHECVIGILNHYSYYDLATLSTLKEHISKRTEYNKSLDANPNLGNYKEIRAKCWTLKSYGDKRKSTDLTRFDFCPECGKKIDWPKIKHLAEQEAPT